MCVSSILVTHAHSYANSPSLKLEIRVIKKYILSPCWVLVATEEMVLM